MSPRTLVAWAERIHVLDENGPTGQASGGKTACGRTVPVPKYRNDAVGIWREVGKPLGVSPTCARCRSMATVKRAANPVDAAYRVSERCQHEKVDGVLLDLTTARAIIAVYEKLSPENRAKMEAMTVTRAATIAWKLVS